MPARRTLSVINLIGELLITAGVLVLLFLAWQLWVNDSITAASNQAQVQNDAASWTVPTPDPSLVAQKDFGPAPVLAKVSAGQIIGNLYVPRLGADATRRVAESVTPKLSLNHGYFGHYAQTAWPGQPGNFALAVHRSGWGTGFKQAQLIRTGDRIYLATPAGYYGYTVRNIEYVKPTSVDVLAAVPGTTVAAPGKTAKAPAGQSLLTITTCSPQNGNAERIVTYAVLDSWRPLKAGPFADLAPLMKKS
jgi:sortase A